MFQVLYSFFLNIFYPDNILSGEGLDYFINSEALTFNTAYGEYTFAMYEYLSIICSLISLIFIVVLCCLFVYKIIKLIGNLIR